MTQLHRALRMTAGGTWMEAPRELGSVAQSGRNACNDSLFSSPFVFCRALMDRQHGVLECWDQMFLLNPTSVYLARTPHLSEGKEHKPLTKTLHLLQMVVCPGGCCYGDERKCRLIKQEMLEKDLLPVWNKILIPTGVPVGDLAVKS